MKVENDTRERIEADCVLFGWPPWQIRELFAKSAAVLRGMASRTDDVVMVGLLRRIAGVGIE